MEKKSIRIKDGDLDGQRLVNVRKLLETLPSRTWTKTYWEGVHRYLDKRWRQQIV